MIWIRKNENENGNYVDKNGIRYTIEWCHRLLTSDNSNEIEHGYEQHTDVNSACEKWGLEIYIDTKIEEIYLNNIYE